MKEKKTRKEIMAVCLLVLSLVLITIGTTFAFFTYSRQGTTENTLHTGTLTFIYDEKRAEKNGVNLTNAFPTSDDKGTKLDKTGEGVFDFEVRAKTSGASINYEIYLTNENSTLPEYAVKTYLRMVSGGESDPEVTGLPTKTNLNLYSALWDSKVPTILNKPEIKGKTLYRETIPSSDEEYTKTFRYRMWIDEDANKVINGSWKYNNMTFSVKVNVYAQNEDITPPTTPDVYKDESGANYPELVEGLIPVRYDTNKKSWVKADLYKEWYDYNNQEWANAVTVYEIKSENGSYDRDYYMSAESGTTIDIDDINTMWVWIPRYEYDYVGIQTAGGTPDQNNYYPNPGVIEINFITGTDKQVSDGNNYKMHPAFTFGDKELTGLWYGKFETSNKEKTCTASNSSVDTDCDLVTFIPEVKPNVTSWRGIRVSTAFTVSQKMMKEYANEYGFTGEDIDTHMSKSSEWGAVAYLSQSKYGKYGNNGEEVLMNSCNEYKTGVAGCSDDYISTTGQKASTTGNITGIYDMSGGAYEYVMGALEDSSNPGKPTVASSGFVSDEVEGNKIPDAKYYDLYTSEDPSSDDVNLSATACNGGVCYGHALSETKWWYGDALTFIGSIYPWSHRGGSLNSSFSGVFAFNRQSGMALIDRSFRLVLAPIK